MSPVSLAYFVALFSKSYGNSSGGGGGNDGKQFLVRFQFPVSVFGIHFAFLSSIFCIFGCFSVFVFLMVLWTLWSSFFIIFFEPKQMRMRMQNAKWEKFYFVDLLFVLGCFLWDSNTSWKRTFHEKQFCGCISGFSAVFLQLCGK